MTSDPQLLERIIGNLVQNAIKYTAQGGVVEAQDALGSLYRLGSNLQRGEFCI